MDTDLLPGYHLTPIDKGVLGQPSKVAEECAEFIDACDQNCQVMALVELADLYGAMRAYLAQQHPSLSMSDLERMADINERAFRNGRRR